MRQAGRYLPEYRRVREQVYFLELCRDAGPRGRGLASADRRDRLGRGDLLLRHLHADPRRWASRSTSDPGPWWPQPIRSAAQVERCACPTRARACRSSFEILRALRAELATREIPLLGFAGAPFTLAAYLVEGGASRHFGTWKRMLWREPATARALLDRLTDLTVGYLGAQIEAGAQAVQLFDTWAGMLSPADYREWVLPTHREIAAKLDRSAPLILYVNDGAHVLEETAESGADVISLDWRVDLADAARRVGPAREPPGQPRPVRARRRPARRSPQGARARSRRGRPRAGTS